MPIIKVTCRTADSLPIEDLIPFQGNLKSLHKAQFEKLKRSILKYGFSFPCFVWDSGNGKFIIDAHQRCNVVREMLKEGYEIEGGQLPVVYIEAKNEKEAKEKVLAATSQYGRMDREGLYELLETSDISFRDMKDVMEFPEIDLDQFEAGYYEGESQDAEPQIDRAKELNEKWKVVPGDIWKIGDHRLLCGDSTKAEDVERVMSGEKVDMVWTDPPYGVKYGEKMDETNPMGYRVRSIQNDDLSAADLLALIRSAYRLACEHSIPGGVIYAAAAAAGDMLKVAIDAFEDSGFTFKWQLIWLKDAFVLSRSDYHFRHENILYGWKEDAAHFFVDDRTQDSVFEYPRPKCSEEHPTMKPIELISHMIQNSSKQGALVYDPFSGSGSTMVACQNLNRKCRGIEISPAYCAVILERMATAFPELEIKLQG